MHGLKETEINGCRVLEYSNGFEIFSKTEKYHLEVVKPNQFMGFTLCKGFINYPSLGSLTIEVAEDFIVTLQTAIIIVKGFTTTH